MKLNAMNLPNTSTCLICSDNNPFFEIHRGSSKDNSQFYKVYDSDIAQNTVHPLYNFFKISGQQLCNSDKNLPLEIRFLNRT